MACGFVLTGCASAPKEYDLAPQSAAVATEPQEALNQFDRALTLLSGGDLDLAAQELEALSTGYPMYAGPLVNLGIAHARAGRLPEAEKAFLAALDRNAESAAAHNQLGVIYRKLGRFADADAAYSQAIAVDPGYAAAHLNLGVLCDLYLQQPERALAEYERYVELIPSPDARVAGWINELKARISSSARTARSEQ